MEGEERRHVKGRKAVTYGRQERLSIMPALTGRFEGSLQGLMGLQRLKRNLYAASDGSV